MSVIGIPSHIRPALEGRAPNSNPTSRIVTIFALVMAMLGTAGWSQNSLPTASTAAPSEATRSVLTHADVASLSAAMEEDTTLTADDKPALRAKYTDAVQALNNAASNAKQTTLYQAALQNATKETTRLENRLKSLPSPDEVSKQIPPDDFADLQKACKTAEATVTTLKAELAETTAELAKVLNRPLEIISRLPEAELALTDVEARLESPDLAPSPDPDRVASRTLLAAQEVELTSEIKTLEAEQLSQSFREDLLKARKAYLTRQVENSLASAETLRAVLDRHLERDANQVQTQADNVLSKKVESDAELTGLATEVRTLARQLESLVSERKKASEAEARAKNLLSTLSQENQLVHEQLSLGQAGGLMATGLFEMRQRLPNDSVLDEEDKARRQVLAQTRLQALEVDSKWRGQSSLESSFAAHPSPAAAELLASRQEVLEKLQVQYEGLIQTQAALVATSGPYEETVRKTRKNLDRDLFWLRSSPPLSLKSLAGILPALDDLFGAARWKELQDAVAEGARGAPVGTTALGVLLLALLVAGGWLRSGITKTAAQIRRISTDRYSHTVKAVFFSGLLAAPLPLFLLSLAWVLSHSSNQSRSLSALSDGLWLAYVIFPLLFMRAIYRQGGVGIAHFGWNKETCLRMRKLTTWFVCTYFPAFLVMRICFLSDNVSNFDSLGRACFLLTMVWVAGAIWLLFRPSGGILFSSIHGRPNSAAARTYWLWFPLLLASPFFLTLLAGIGYLLTAVLLSLELVISASTLAGIVVLYWLVLRWFMIRERRLALAQALQDREARRDAAMAEDEGRNTKSGEVVDVDEVELDLFSLGEQTRRLLRFFFGLGAIFSLAVIWSHRIPIFSALDAIHPMGGASLLDWTQVGLILFFTAMASRNLSGFLELAILGGSKIESGTRIAIITLCQYALVAVALAMVFGILQVDWAKFAWIAAALSVGLGFGLQEVVANFVCGLIVLFECPIRVGDVVTVDGTTGTVTQIRMRATTIVNWDRQEYVVPNKNLITGTLLNWTLSTSVNRILITVGVAYGSNTGQARQILLEVATDHPAVLHDPAPMASFEEFADSSLTLRLRAYLPNVDDRVKVLTELHTEIDKRFAAAGLEIAFPQRDLHIRAVDPEIRLTSKTKTSEST